MPTYSDGSWVNCHHRLGRVPKSGGITGAGSTDCPRSSERVLEGVPSRPVPSRFSRPEAEARASFSHSSAAKQTNGCSPFGGTEFLT